MEFKFLGLEGGIDEGQITQIYVKPGSNVKKGDDLFELEADKLSQAITAEDDGVIGVINFEVGQLIKKGDVFASSQANTSPSGEVSKQATVTKIEKNQQESAINVAEQKEANFVKVLATPLARSIARELKIDINKIKGTGPNGRVLKADILANNQTGTLPANDAVAPPEQTIKTVPPIGEEPIRRQKMTAIRKAIAKAMVTSKTTIPHVSLMNEVNVTKLVALRSSLKATIKENSNLKITYMPFFVMAVVTALKEFPILNASMDDKTEEIIFHDYYHIGMAVDTAKGLIVPVIKYADQLTLHKLAAAITNITNGRNSDFSGIPIRGSTFTITNFGSVGLSFGTPVINYPESAILGVGAITKKPIVDKNGEIVIADMLPLSISIDHRIIDGADAGRFMSRIKELLEEPVGLWI